MKAAVCRAFGEPLVIEELTLAEPGPDEVRVKLGATAICHSDIIFLDGGWGGALPAVLGHEAAGTVIAIGEGVDNVQVGDTVVVTLVRHCGACAYCENGQDVMCEASFPLDDPGPLATPDGESIHQGLRTGAFAEEVVVGASQVCAIPASIPLVSAALIGCGVMTGVGAVRNTAAVPAGASVAVIGIGGVGINAVQGAVLAGADPIVALDVNDAKLDTARQFGATHAANARDADAVRRTREWTGKGADFVFVTAGAKPAFDQAIPLLARGGTAVIVGMPATGVMASYDPGELAGASQRIVGSKMGSCRVREDIPYLASLYAAGRLELDSLVSQRYPLTDINEALAASKRGDALRNVIVF